MRYCTYKRAETRSLRLKKEEELLKATPASFLTK